jgi:hypothetical protein
LKKNLGLDILNQGDAILLNVTRDPVIRPSSRRSTPREEGLRRLHGGPGYAEDHREFGVEKFGSPLFFRMPGRKRNPGQVTGRFAPPVSRPRRIRSGLNEEPARRDDSRRIVAAGFAIATTAGVFWT